MYKLPYEYLYLKLMQLDHHLQNISTYAHNETLFY